MDFSKYIACLCEGSAENAVMDLLLDDDRLKFTRDDLLEGEVLTIGPPGKSLSS